MEIDARETQLLGLLRREGPLSRRELHARTGIRPNTVGELADRMLQAGLIREGDPRVEGPGRPSVPLEIDPQRRFVAGLALEPGRVSLARLNLHGRRVGPIVSREAQGEDAVTAGRELLRGLDHDALVGVGLCVTGFIDVDRRTLLVSSVAPGRDQVSLSPLFDAIPGARVVLENDLQALAVQWMLAHEAETHEDILLVYVRDGAVGAAVLINGRPNRGCVLGGNELGHTRLPVETDRCFCGHTGCLEKIFSTGFLRRHRGADAPSLAEAAAAFDDRDSVIREVSAYLAMGVANAINLLRPSRVVLASELNRSAAFTNHLLGEVRAGMLDTLAQRVRIDLWDQPSVQFAEAAGWLALASLYRAEWLQT